MFKLHSNLLFYQCPWVPLEEVQMVLVTHSTQPCRTA
jgi:hypothetical protein